MAMAMITPLILTLTTTTAEENILTNAKLIQVFPYLEKGSSLTGKFTMLFNGTNQVEFNNEGVWHDLIGDSAWDSNGDNISVSSVKIKNPCTFTLILDTQ